MISKTKQVSAGQSTANVTVIGGGLAGLAASIHLSKEGLSVTCLEPSVNFQHLVGESLDWSAPELFNDLDLPMQDLVQARVSTYNRYVVLKMQDQSSSEYIPWPWLRRAPFNIELRTLHVDRTLLHQHLLEQAIEHGVEILRDKAVVIEGMARDLNP